MARAYHCTHDMHRQAHGHTTEQVGGCAMQVKISSHLILYE